MNLVFYYDDELRMHRDVGRKLVTRVVFLLNVAKVGGYALYLAANLVVVETPEGIVSIGESAFEHCRSLTTVSFPNTLTSIGEYAFNHCASLDNVDLLHTNLQELGTWAFALCSELKSMMIPGLLQTLGRNVFRNCSKLVSSSIVVSEFFDDKTSEVVAHLRSLQI